MTKEQAIEIIKGMIKSYIEADKCGLSNNDFKHEIRALQTVLNMLKEKDAEIEKLKSFVCHLQLEDIKNLKTKICMAEQLAGLAIFDDDKEEPLILGDKEEVIKYFERKSNEI